MSSFVNTPCSREPAAFVSSNPRTQEANKHRCLSCPVAPACLAECLEYEEASGTTKIGVYGGTTTAERARAAEIRRSA